MRPQVRSARAVQEVEISGRPVSISTKNGLIEIDLRDAFDLFLPEVPEPPEPPDLPKPSDPSALLCILPAGSPNINPAALANERGEAGTEDLRQAIVHYRALFEDLLETREREVAQ